MKENEVLKAVDAVEETQFLSAEDILSSEDITTLDLEIPEWPKNGRPGVVRLKTMTGAEAVKFEKVMKGPQRDLGTPLLISACAVKQDGTPLFTSDQVAKLQQKSVRVFNRLQKAALELNGFTKEAEEVAKNA